MNEGSGNPFPLTGYHGVENFCDRKEETAFLLSSLQPGNTVVLTGIHGIGKSTLIGHVGATFQSKKGQVYFHVSLKPAMNCRDFICLLAAATLAHLNKDHLKLMRELANYFTHLRPMITYDPISGSPKLGFTLDDAYKADHTIEQILTYLNRQNLQLFLAFDDAQQFFDFPEKQVFSLLRSHLLMQDNMRFLFSTDNDSAAQKILAVAEADGKPKHHIALKAIDYDVYRTYIVDKFQSAKRKMPESIIEMLLDWSRQHTATTQLICNRLFLTGIKQPDQWFLERVMAETMSENDAVFYTYRRLLTGNQWLLLRAIATEKGARQVLGAEFIRKYALGSTSSVQTALAALQDKEMIYQDEARFWLQDVLLSRWLEQD